MSLLAAPIVEYLGHYFSKNGIVVNPLSYHIQYQKSPNSWKVFLDWHVIVINFAQGYSTIVAPHRLFRKDTVFHWSKSCDEMLEQSNTGLS